MIFVEVADHFGHSLVEFEVELVDVLVEVVLELVLLVLLVVVVLVVVDVMANVTPETYHWRMFLSSEDEKNMFW